MIFQLLVFVYLITAAFSSPISPHLFCEEKRWQSIFIFFATNYFAHALTTIPDPGAKWTNHLGSSTRTLLLPNIQLIETIKSVICHIVQGGSDDLHRALAQEALLILVKTDDKAPGDINFSDAASSFRVHGDISIPKGYSLILPSYPRHQKELALAFRKSDSITMGGSTEVASAVIAIAQVIFSSITIYRTRGDQIERYGYAAYGLSVYPYALMSLANLVKLAVCGRYPFLYVLRTATLVEAEKKGRVFEGAVGNLGVNHGKSDEVVNDSQHDPEVNRGKSDEVINDSQHDSEVNREKSGEVVNDSQHDELIAAFSEPPYWFLSLPSFRPLGDYRGRKWIVPVIGSLIFVIAAVSHPVFVQLVSGFNRGQSTRAQRAWMLGWLITNGVSALVNLVSPEISSGKYRKVKSILAPRGGLFVYSAYVFAIGGFVNVGGMLRAESYQLCNI